VGESRPAGNDEGGVGLGRRAKVRDARCFFRGAPSSQGGIVLLLLLRKMTSCGNVFRAMSSGWLE